MSVAGVLVLADRVQAVVRGARGSVRTHEVPRHDGDAPDAVIAALRAALGPAGRVHLGVGLAHLAVKQVQLPPVARDDQRRMLALDPARWFAVPADATLAVSLAPGEAVAFAADAAWLARWVAAAETWAPVATVEPVPVSVARVLAAHGLRDVTVPLEAGAGEAGHLTLERGLVTRVRRHLRGMSVGHAPERSADPVPDPVPDAVPDPLGPVSLAFAGAYGAALAPRDDQSAALLTPALDARFARAARRRLAIAATAAGFALASLAWAAGTARDRRLAWLEREVAALQVPAAPGLALLDSAARLDQERAVVESVTSARTPTLDAFARLSERLPAGAMAQRVRIAGRTWQVDGSAPASAPVLAALAAESTFTDVKLLAPSARFQDGTASRETFSIGFVVR